MPDIYSLIQSTGPGQIKDVVADIRALVDDDDKVTSSCKPQLAKYNKTQLITVKVGTTSVIVSEHNELGDGKFFDAISGQSFDFDHQKLVASSVEPYEVPEQSTVASLATKLQKYTDEHYPSQAAVSVTPKDGSFKICIVGNKYNTQNFWTGRWRGVYTYSPTTSKLTGEIQVDVHYYEDGNVRLLTTKELDLEATHIDLVAKTIETAEKKYQDELNKAFGVLGEGSFKELRRALPVTRSKINWDSVSAMRIGQDVQGGREKKLPNFTSHSRIARCAPLHSTPLSTRLRMSKRANGETNGESERDDKRPKVETTAESAAVDEDAEWEAFQSIIAETKTDESVEQKTTIELAAEADDSEGEDEDEGVTERWDEEETTVERRMEEQNKRKAYLERLRAEHASRTRDTVQATEATTQIEEEEESDEDEEEEDEGWIRQT